MKWVCNQFSSKNLKFQVWLFQSHMKVHDFTIHACIPFAIEITWAKHHLMTNTWTTINPRIVTWVVHHLKLAHAFGNTRIYIITFSHLPSSSSWLFCCSHLCTLWPQMTLKTCSVLFRSVPSPSGFSTGGNLPSSAHSISFLVYHAWYETSRIFGSCSKYISRRVSLAHCVILLKIGRSCCLAAVWFKVLRLVVII